MKRMTKGQNQWMRWTSWLFMVVTFFVTPATSMAASTQPQAINLTPSNYMPMLHNNACSGTRAASNPIGTQVYGLTGYNRSYFALLQNSYTPWLRNQISWLKVEPTNRPPSQYNWPSADGAVQAAIANCANMVITLVDTPGWATIGGGHSPFQPAFLDDFVEFVTAVVERYDGDGDADAPGGPVVNYWEFYNEPDLGSVTSDEGWGEHGERYAQMLEAIYDRVHQANPNAKVVLGGISYDYFIENEGLSVREFLQNVLDAGGGDYFDIMNFHYYPFHFSRVIWTESNSSGLMEKYADVKAKLQAKGLDKPIMITEIGWHSATPDRFYPSNVEYQSRHVIQLLTQSMAAGAMVTIWWSLVEIVTDGFPYRTGLVAAEPPHKPKPAFAVYREAVRRLGPSKSDGVFKAATKESDLEVYRFLEEGTNKVFYVGWLNPIAPLIADAVASFDDTETQNLQVPGSKANIYAKEGNLILTVNDGDDGANDGVLTVVVGRNPIYIVID